MSNLTRDFSADLEIRSDGTGRTIHGILVPYGQVARVSDGGPFYDEVFAPGAFARDIQARNGDYSRVKFLMHHDRKAPIGRAVELSEDTSGMYGAFRVAATAAGDEALELVREGVLDSFSISFVPVDPSPSAGIPADGRVTRTKASLRETSLVTFPAYAGAAVAGVRATDDSSPGDPAEGLAESTADGRPDLHTDPDPARATPLGLSPAQRRAWLLNQLTLKGA